MAEFGGLNATPVYTEDGVSVVLDADATVSDAELDALNAGLGNYSGAVLRLERVGGANSADIFAILSGGNLTVDSSTISVGGNVIATYTNVGGQLEITFTDGNGTVPTTALVNEVLQGITYENGSDNPSANATIAYTIDDGTLVGAGSVVVAITATNDAPTFSGLDSSPTHIEGGAAVFLDADVTVLDAELGALNGGLGNFSGAVLTLARNGGASTDDVFAITAGGNLTVGASTIVVGGNIVANYTNTGGQLEITFTDSGGTAPTSALVDEILQAITYENISVSPPANVTIDYTIDDGNILDQGAGGALTSIGSVTVPTGLLSVAAAMGERDWIVIPNTDMPLLTEAEAQLLLIANGGSPFWGNTGSDSVLIAWTSSAFDAEANKMYFFGGGHADYGGNEVYEFDFNTLAWTRLTDPAPLVVANGVWGEPADSPPSVHTYDGLLWNPDTDTLWLTNTGYGFGNPTSATQKGVWEFDPATGAWTLHAAPNNTTFGNTFYSEEFNQVVHLHDQFSNRAAYAYDGDGTRHDLGKVSGPFGKDGDYESNAFSNTLTGEDYVVTDKAIYKLTYDGRRVVSRAAASLPDLGVTWDMAAYAFNEADGRFYIWNGGRGIVTWDPADNSFEPLSNAASRVAPSKGTATGRVFDKWVYLDEAGVFAGIKNDDEGGIWLYKPDRARPGTVQKSGSSPEDPAPVAGAVPKLKPEIENRNIVIEYNNNKNKDDDGTEVDIKNENLNIMDHIILQ